MNILIAEDRNEDRYLLGTILRSGGHRVIEASNGKAALDMAQTQSMDLIISDVLMPEMDGYMFCRHIHEIPSLRDIPFVFLTATYRSRSDELFAMKLGADHFVRKPVDPDVILKLVDKFARKPKTDSPPDKTIENDSQFTKRHSQRILSALKHKSDELEELVEKLEHTQTALKASEKQYRLLSSLTSDYVYALNLDKEGRLVVDWISGAFERITGFNPYEIQVFDDWLAKVVPEDRHLFQSTLAHKRSRETWSLEYRIVTAAGDTVWLKDISRPVMDEYGQMIARAGAVRDITETKKSEIRLKRLATAVESAAESILITDADGRIQYVNPAFESISGYTAEEVRGKTPSFLKSGKHSRHFYQSMWQILKKGGVWRGNIINRRKNDTFYEIEAVISPIKSSEGDITHYIAVRRDVTREKALEQQVRQAQKLEAIGTLAGGIAHDFNNILSAIIGFTELSIPGVEHDPDLRSNLREVLQAGNRARDLVQQILTFARQNEHEDKPVQLELIIKEALKMLRASLPATIEIIYDFQSKDMVMGDPTQLHQIIMNLCTNAAFAMQDGGELTIKLQNAEVDSLTAGQDPQLRQGNYLRLMVGDNGCGMTRSQLERIFEPFYTTKQKGEGTGLGLAVVHGIVQNHGGAIKVYSEQGFGSTFNVFLPAIERVDRPVPEKAVSPLPRGREKIIVIDDEPAIANLCSRMLTLLGYKVTAFTSSVEAMEKFKARPETFDLVISDVTMPKITGDEIAQRVKAIRPEIPVILCTGFTRLISETDAEALGVRAILTKPIVRRELATTVRAAIDGHQG